MREYKFLFSQRDPRWALTLINNIQGATTGLYGCLIISWEMKANYYGHFLTPPQLAQLLSQHSLFTNGDFVSSDDALSKVFSDIKYVKTNDFTGVPADLAELQRLSDSGDEITVTLELDFDHNPNDGIQTHFVELHSYNGSVLRIIDPWDGKEKDFTDTYGNDPATTIQKYIVYSGRPSTGNVEVTTGGNDMMPVLISDWKGLLVEAGSLERIAPLFGFSQADCKDDIDVGMKIAEQVNQLRQQVLAKPISTNTTGNTPPQATNDSPASIALPSQPNPPLTPVQKNWFLAKLALLFG